MVCLALAFGAQAAAQTEAAGPVPDGWSCDDTNCIEAKPAQFLELIGTFLSGARLSTINKVNAVAALEQQSQREFEFEVNEAALISVTLTPDESYRPEGWDGSDADTPLPDPLLWVSNDGESYERLTADVPVQPGDLLLAAVRQVFVEGDDDTISYLPARWTLSLEQRRVVQNANAILPDAAPRVPTLVAADADPVPEEAASVPPVEGAAQLSGGADCAGAGCNAPEDAAPSAPVNNELAVELQRELARVGCYNADIDGLWGPASRRALAAFYAAQNGETTRDGPTPRALVTVSRADASVCAGE